MMDLDAARAHWASMTHRERLFFVVANGNAASFAYDRLEVHREAARAQMSRIESAIQRSRPDGPEPESGASQVESREYVRRGVEHMRPVLYEVHFYFVAWGNCRNMLAILTGLPEMLEAKKVFDRHRKDFDHHVAGRNSFEHYHDRLPGDPKRRGSKSYARTRRRARTASTPGSRMECMCTPTGRGTSLVRVWSSSRMWWRKAWRSCIASSMKNSFAKECRPTPNWGRRAHGLVRLCRRGARLNCNGRRTRSTAFKARGRRQSMREVNTMSVRSRSSV